MPNLNEAKTRALLINPQLERAGWNLSDHSQVQIEVPVHGYDPTPWNGYTDFCLYSPDGSILAVIEAKKTARNARDGEEQLRQYIAEIGSKQRVPPFGFMTNGMHHFFWEVGLSHPRAVSGFFSQADLERLRFIRENRTALKDTPIRKTIVNRAYQHEAIRRVAEAFESGRRRALLVMATGTGKTRTTMALIDVFLQSSYAQKVLFLADRDALVEQALHDGFKTFLPNEPRVRIRTSNIDTTKRLYVATQQTMGVCYENFPPAFFDLIVFDEAHRSIFNRFTEVIEYFDARMVGLTATPAAFIDRDTFRVFDCRDQTPTFLYTYDQAIKEGHLVDFTLYQAHTGFQRGGIKGADLSEEDRNALIEQGLDPDALDYAGTDLEVLVTNRDTLRKQWEEIMNVCIKDRSGSLPGKTIVFAMTKEHADRIREVFEEMFPQYAGLLQVIYTGVERVHDGPYGDGLISKFKKEDKPRFAVSVDMLDTGIDVPEVVNLVFMKPVHSRIKLWQMIGRGTRNQEACRFFERLPDGEKTGFLIIDFWQNDFGKQTEERVPSEMPLLTRLFNTRLDIITATLNRRGDPSHVQAIADCRAMLMRVPTDSFLIRKAWPEIESAWTDDFWSTINAQRIEFLRLRVAPQLRFVPDVDVAAETFTNKVERLALAQLKGTPSPEQLASISEDVSRLPQEIRERLSKADAARLALSTMLVQATRSQLTEMIRELASEMKNKRRTDNSFIAIDLPDFIATAQHVIIMPNGTPVHVEEYRKRIDQRILRIADEHPALRALREGRSPTSEQLIDLERILHSELESSDINFSDKAARAVYGLKWNNHVGFLGLLRHVLALDAIPDYASVVGQSFEEHITSHNYTGDQIRFLRAVEDIFLSTRRLSEIDLHDAPQLTAFGRNAVDRLFSPVQVEELVRLTEELAVLMVMLADTKLRSQVDSLWDKLWSGGLSNPLDAIEQLSFLFFLKQLDEREQDAQRAAKRRGQTYAPLFDNEQLRWSYWSQLPGDKAVAIVKEKVFPFLKKLGGKTGSFGEHMATAEFKISKPSLLIEACRAIDEMQISSQNQDVQGDLYEYLLSRLNTAGTNGQFRTPRHIIRMMVQMIDPQPGERVIDPAAGTCGFLVNAWQHLLETHTDRRDLRYDDEGWPHGLTGSKLAKEEWDFSQREAFTGYDSDSGMTMLRIGSMNLMLHGLTVPRFHYADTLSKAFTEESHYDVVLANPPFKGAIDASDVNPTLPTKVKKTELLFLHLFMRLLDNGGRGAVIVPDGVLFGSSNAHVEARKKLIEENRLDAVISMPSGVFRPYAGVSTAILFFTKGAKTDRIWFYDMEHDGFSLDDKRQRVPENDIPNILECWKYRADKSFSAQRSARVATLQKQLAPLKRDRLEHHEIIHRLKFEEVVADEPEKARTSRESAEAELSELQERIAPLQAELNQLGRQFWVNKKQVVANKCDLSASRYQDVERDEEFFEKPVVTLDRLTQLEATATRHMAMLQTMLSKQK